MNIAVKDLKPSFPVRHMNYAFEKTKRYWMADDPISTHYFTSLSLLFPEGEKYFVNSVRAVRDLVKNNPQLEKDIGAFIGQEAMHSKEHHAFHAAARKYNLDPDSLEKNVGVILKKYFTFRSKKLNLAITAGLEHFTAVLVVEMMAEISHHMTDDTIRHLWLWHSIEETEHKAVAFDVYQEIYGTDMSAYFPRVAMFSLGVVMLLAIQTDMMVRLIVRDKQFGNIKSWAKFASTIGIGFPLLIPKFLKYYSPNFHPNDTDETRLVAETKLRIGLADVVTTATARAAIMPA